MVCPKCGVPELHPDGDKLYIRGMKICLDGVWHSQCLKCAGYYNEYGDFDESKGDPKLGWFTER